MKDEIFRKKSLDRVKSPERLNEYVKVASPALWLILIGIILLLVGAIVWASTYRLEVSCTFDGIVDDNSISISMKETDFSFLEEGNIVLVNGKETKVDKIDKKSKLAYAQVDLEDGKYTGYVYLQIKPISYIFN